MLGGAKDTALLLRRPQPDCLIPCPLSFGQEANISLIWLPNRIDGRIAKLPSSMPRRASDHYLDTGVHLEGNKLPSDRYQAIQLMTNFIRSRISPTSALRDVEEYERLNRGVSLDLRTGTGQRNRSDEVLDLCRDIVPLHRGLHDAFAHDQRLRR